MPGRPRNAAAATAILTAAVAALRERGYAGLTLDEVAERAGIGKSSLYSRFSDKATLAVAALASLQREVPPPTGMLREDLIAHLRAAERDLATAGPEVLGTVLGLHAGREHDGLLAIRAHHLRRLLEAALERGALRPDSDLDAVVAALVGAALTRILAPQLSPEPWPHRVLDPILLACQGSGKG